MKGAKESIDDKVSTFISSGKTLILNRLKSEVCILKQSQTHGHAHVCTHTQNIRHLVKNTIGK